MIPLSLDQGDLKSRVQNLKVNLEVSEIQERAN